jgi:hypothetical protein
MAIGSAVSDLTFAENTITDLAFTTIWEKRVVRLPDRSITGTNVIKSNAVSMRATNSAHFIDWSGGGQGNSDIRSSNLSITDNHLSGFDRSTIRIGAQGLTEIRRNTFSNVSSQTTGSAEEYTDGNDRTDGFMVHNRSGSNRQIRPWIPQAYYAVNDKCQMTVLVQKGVNGNNDASLDPNPVTLDFFATSTNDAELFVGSVPVGSLTATGFVQVTLDVTPLSGKSGMKLRIQTSEQRTSGEDTYFGSSQFSRWMDLEKIECKSPDPTILKEGFVEGENGRVKVEPESTLKYGQTVFWKYTVTNPGSQPVDVTVRDSMKTQDDGVVCSITVPGNTTMACDEEWSQTMSPEVVGDG